MENNNSENRNIKNRNTKTNIKTNTNANPNSLKMKPQRRPAPMAASRPARNRVSIIIPLYNEEESLQPLSSDIRKVCITNNYDFEVIMVDDGSTDGSLKVMKDICRGDVRFKYVSFQKNYGKSAALNVGFKMATGQYVITMDADLQDDPIEIPNLIAKVKDGYDVVSGWKKKRYDPFIKKHSSKFFNWVTKVFSGVKIHDFNCGLKIYKKVVTDNVRIYGELHRYIPVLASWKGFKVGEIVVQHHPRQYGKTKFGVSRFFKGFVDLLTVVFITRYVKRPMHLFGFMGGLSTLAGLVINAILSYEKIVCGLPLSNRPMLFLGVLLMIIGLQFFSMGLIGEMIVHNNKNNDEYVIKEKNIAK